MSLATSSIHAWVSDSQTADKRVRDAGRTTCVESRLLICEVQSSGVQASDYSTCILQDALPDHENAELRLKPPP